jgi:hypothetical protein
MYGRSYTAARLVCPPPSPLERNCLLIPLTCTIQLAIESQMLGNAKTKEEARQRKSLYATQVCGGTACRAFMWQFTSFYSQSTIRASASSSLSLSIIYSSLSMELPPLKICAHHILRPYLTQLVKCISVILSHYVSYSTNKNNTRREEICKTHPQ